MQQSRVEPKTVAPRASIVEPFVPFMLEQLAKYPSLRASRLFSMVKARGFTDTLVDRLIHRANEIEIEAES